MDEEDAFLMLTALLEKHEMAGLFRPGLPLLDLYFYQFQRLLQERNPALYDYLEMLGVGPTMYASQWFMTIFAYNFPFEAVVRIWDVFLNEGKTTLFRVALAILESHQDDLLTDTFERMLQRLKGAPNILTGAQLLDLALRIDVSRETLAKLEDEYMESRSEAQSPPPISNSK
eukprot:GHVN01043688.1.p1 GENE.GHVN01043688.1~~GHVN01043688.1.p1  ORF type:complete len:197 (+),score=35.07 GHVN01043688.1:74-592(+)